MARPALLGCISAVLLVAASRLTAGERATALQAPGTLRIENASPACQPATLAVTAARNSLAAKDYPRAIERFQSALQQCPSSEDAALGLAHAYLETRSFTAAEQRAREVVARDPRSEEAQFLLADSLFLQQKFQLAGQTLEKLLAQDSSNADAHKLLGLTLFFYKQDVMAEKELRTALQLRPDDEEALYDLGRVYYTQNNFPPAARTFERLIARDPQYYRAYDNLALCYEAMGRTGDAEAMFKKAQAMAQRLDPTYDWPYADLADMLLRQDRAAEALPYAREAIGINPKSARDQYLVGKAFLRTGSLEPALKHLSASAELDPQLADPHYLLGQIYKKQHDLQKARREFALFEKLQAETPHQRR